MISDTEMRRGVCRLFVVSDAFRFLSLFRHCSLWCVLPTVTEALRLLGRAKVVADPSLQSVVYHTPATPPCGLSCSWSHLGGVALGFPCPLAGFLKVSPTPPDRWVFPSSLLKNVTTIHPHLGHSGCCVFRPHYVSSSNALDQFFFSFPW